MTVFTDKAIKYVPRLMNDLQIDRIQACGIFGNIGGETGGFMALQEIKPTVAGSKGGYGWLQWTGPRRVKYEAWCKANQMNPKDDESNYQYLVNETKTDEMHSLIQLRKTTTLASATETFMLQNLRPGVKNLKSRTDWAQKAYDATAVKAQDAKAVTSGAGIVVITGGAIASTPHHFWPWLLIGGGVALIIAWLGVKLYHKAEAQQAALPKGKK
jgi:hypothetical protein